MTKYLTVFAVSLIALLALVLFAGQSGKPAEKAPEPAKKPSLIPSLAFSEGVQEVVAMKRVHYRLQITVEELGKQINAQSSFLDSQIPAGYTWNPQTRMFDPKPDVQPETKSPPK